MPGLAQSWFAPAQTRRREQGSRTGLETACSAYAPPSVRSMVADRASPFAIHDAAKRFSATAVQPRSEPRDRAIRRRRAGSPSARKSHTRALFQLGAKESPPTQGKGRGSQEKKRGGWLRKPRVICTVTYIKPWRATLDRLKLPSAADLRLHAAAVRAAKSSRC